MNITVNKTSINYLYSDKTFIRETEAFLNAVIDGEIEKADGMDTELIDECVDMLLKLEEEKDNGLAVIIPLLDSKKIMSACHKNNFRYLSRGMRASLIACIILLSALTANTAIAEIFDYNIAQEVVSSISEKLQEWGIIASAESSNETVVDEIPSTAAASEKMTENEPQPVTQTENTQTANKEETASASPKASPAPSDSRDLQEETTASVAVTDITAEETENNVNEKNAYETEIRLVTEKTGIYTLYLDSEGGICNIQSVRVEYNKPIGELPTPVKDGFEFSGWYNTDITCKGKLSPLYTARPLKESDVYNLESDAVAVAKWDKIYTITFDANGGVCDTQSMKTTSSEKLTALPIPEREGYAFDGWYYDGTRINENSTIPKNKDLTFTAHWILDERDFILTFNANGGQCSLTAKKIVYDEPYGELPIPTRDGYTFMGWHKNGGDSLYFYPLITEDTIADERNDITAYAVWGDNSEIYTLCFDAGEGECDVKTKAVFGNLEYGELPVPVRYGYDFSGWYDKNGNRLNETDHVQFPRARVETVYAHWQETEVNIVFDANGGKFYSSFTGAYNNTRTRKVKYLSELGSLPLPETYLGHRFEGWYTESENGVQVNETDIIDFAEKRTYYAHWSVMEDCRVKIHMNDGTGRIYSDTVQYGQVVDIDTLEIPDSDKVFLGWFTDSIAGEKIKGSIDITEDTDIYAHWKQADTYLIKVHMNNSQRTVELITVGKGGTVGEIEKPKMSGAKFLGWYTEEYFGEKIDENTVVTGDMDIYAHWSLNAYYLGVKSNSKLNYELGESFDPSTLKLYISVYFVTVNLDEEDMAYVRCDADTGTYGKKTVNITYIQDCDDGVFTHTCTTEIFVTGCPHNTSAHIEGYVEPTCINGYSGDVICDGCGEIIESGVTLEAVGHNENTEYKVINALEPTCGADGYSGDVICAQCGEMLAEGCLIEALGHNENTQVCIVNQSDADCTNDGYTGDTVCAECGAVLVKGETVKALGHQTERTVKKASFDEDGYVYETCLRCQKVLEDRIIYKVDNVEFDNEEFKYDGTEKEPYVYVLSSNNTFIDDYTLEYDSTATEVGSYPVKVILTGDNYEGEKVLYYKILPPETTVEKITPLSQGMLIKWNVRNEQTDGYQIAYNTSRMFTGSESITTVEGGDVSETELTGLLSETRYYIRIRTYKDVIENGEAVRYYSYWSSIKSINVK